MNDMDALISVIVPVYRVALYLRECVDSILHQTYRNIELILVDDGSDDACPSICDAYALADERVKVVHQPNSGVSMARNAGIELAAGGYIAFVDGDDVVHPELLQRLYAAIQEDGSQMAVSSYQFLPETVRRHERDQGTRRCCMAGEEAAGGMLLSIYAVSTCVKLFNAQLFKQMGVRYPEGIRFSEDAVVSYMTFALSERVSMIPESLYSYRMRKTSVTHDEKAIADGICRVECGMRMRAFAQRVLPTQIPLCDTFTICSAIQYVNLCMHSGILENRALRAMRRKILDMTPGVKPNHTLSLRIRVSWWLLRLGVIPYKLVFLLFSHEPQKEEL